MRTVRQLLCLSAVLALTASVADAQAPQRQRGQRGQGGRGLVTPLALLQSKTVREEVKITEDQTEKLKEAATSLREKVGTAMREAMKDLDQSDRQAMQKAMAKAQSETSALVYKELDGVLKPEQVTRMKQIEVQANGLMAFGIPRVKDALKITEDQAEKLKPIQQDAGKEMRDLGEEYGSQFGQPPADADKAKEFAKKSGMITKDAMTKVLAIMTDEQKAEYKKLAGEPVDVAKIATETRNTFRPKKKNDD